MGILSAKEVAQYILVNQNKAGVAERITHLKLQKLCYYAQGIALARFGHPMFSDGIERWQYGPVVRSLWLEYRGYGDTPLPVPEESFDTAQIGDEAAHLLDEVIKKYGVRTAGELINMTHAEPPWRETPDQYQITHQKMRDYFQTVGEGMTPEGQHDQAGQETESLAAKMADDATFRKLTEQGLAELAAGQYYPWAEIRKSLADL